MVDNPEGFLPRPRVGVADAVAGQLRGRILSGVLADGDLLPKQEELMEDYGVSRPALREALRILETEGLVEVRRGNVGGAVVRIPTPEAAAYTLGLVLQARQVPFSEVRAAVRQLEPVCAGLCASRPDRRRTVLPPLRSTQRDLRRAVRDDDSPAVLSAARGFHEAIVASCGSETLIVLTGTLEALWTARARHVEARESALGHSHDPRFREQTVEAHEELIHYVERGEVDLATRAARLHLETAQLHPDPGPFEEVVEAAMVRDHYFGSGRPDSPRGSL